MTTAAPAEMVRERTRDYLTASLCRPVADEEDIFASGMANSLFSVQLVAFVENEFGIAVEDDELDPANFRSTDAITAFVAGKLTGRTG